MTEPPIELMTMFRADLGTQQPWRIGELRYAAGLELPSPARCAGAVFESRDGRAVALIAGADRRHAERGAAELGPGARLFEVRTEWSRPDDRWVSLNPRLWRRRTDRPASR